MIRLNRAAQLMTRLIIVRNRKDFTVKHLSLIQIKKRLYATVSFKFPSLGLSRPVATKPSQMNYRISKYFKAEVLYKRGNSRTQNGKI